MLLPQLPCVHRCVSEMRVCVYVCACVCVSMGYEGPTLCSHEDKENGGGVCVCVCVCACVCVHMCTETVVQYTYSTASMLEEVQRPYGVCFTGCIHFQVYLPTCTRMNVLRGCVGVCMCAHTCVHVCAHVCVCVCMCLCVGMYVCACACVCRAHLWF